MDFKKLNEELEKYIINELSPELKQKVVNIRKQQIKDLENKFNPKINAAKQQFDDAEKKVKKVTKEDRGKSHEKHLILKYNDYAVYIRLLNKSRSYWNGEPEMYWQIEIYENNKFLEIVGTKENEYNIRSSVCTWLFNKLEEDLEQKKVKTVADIHLQVIPGIVDMIKRYDIPYYYDRYDEYKLIVENKDIFNYLMNIRATLPALKQLKPYFYASKRDKSPAIYNESLNEVNDKTIYKTVQQRIKNYDDARNNYNNLIDERDKSKLALLKRKLKQDQGMISGKDKEKRSIDRGIYLFDIHDRLNKKVEELKKKFPMFSFETPAEYGSYNYYITIIIPLGQYKCLCDYDFFKIEKLKNKQDTYRFTFEYSTDIDTEEKVIRKQIKDAFKTTNLTGKMTGSKYLMGQFTETDKELFRSQFENLEEMLTKMVEVYNNFEQLQNRIEKRKDRAPRQETQYIDLFYEKSQWGLDIQLKVMRKGYQVVSHVGGWDYDEYDPNAQTDNMSRVCRDWKKAIDQAVQQCLEEDDLVQDLLYGGDIYNGFADNEYAQYFQSKL